MTIPQIISVTAAAGVAVMYAWPWLQWLLAGSKDPVLLTHLRNVIAVRDAYKTPEVGKACNALMEALLGIK